MERTKEALVVDVRTDRGELQRVGAGQSGEGRCRYAERDGGYCGAKARAGTERCLKHEAWEASRWGKAGLQFPGDARGMQEFLALVLGMIVERGMTTEQANSIASICRVMERNLRQCGVEQRWEEWRER